MEILEYYLFENKQKRNKQQRIVNRIRLLAFFLPLKYIQPYRLNQVVNSKLISKISYLSRGEHFELGMLKKIDIIIRSIIKIKTGLDKKLNSECFYLDLNEGGFRLTKAEEVANNCYMSSFLNYLNHKLKPIRRNFEEVYFNSFDSKDKNFFTKVYKITKPYCIRQGKCKTGRTYSKIGKFNKFNIYTNRSYLKGWSGGRIHIRGHKNGKVRIFNRRLNFGKDTNNKREILSILHVIKELLKHSTANVFVDSNVALGALTNKKYKGKFEILSRTFNKIIRHKKLNIQLIKVESHCGNKDNEKVDALAKEGVGVIDFREIEEYISKTYSYLIKNKKQTDEEDYNPESIFNLYTWSKQFKRPSSCNLIGLWMRCNVNILIKKYKFLGYKNQGLIEYKYGQNMNHCHICHKERRVKHILDKCMITKQNILRCNNITVKYINSREKLNKIILRIQF